MSTAVGTPSEPATGLPPAGADEAALRRFLEGLPAVDPVGLEQRAAGLATRSIKKDSKLAAIDLAIAMVDLTTLEGADSPGKIVNLCRKALTPDAGAPDTPRPAAVCVYPDRVAVAKETLGDSGVLVASVASAFPAGRSSLEVKIADTELAVAAGADEVDMVIDRGAFLAGRYGLVHDQIVAIKQAAGRARLKVILETGELATYDNVRRAAWLALLAGADFVKTSTGKVSPAATLPVTHVLLQAVRDWKLLTGEQRAVKPAGGIRTTKDAIRYLVAVHEVAGPEWLDPHWFRFGASSVLNDLIMQRQAQRAGHYWGADYVSLD
ncbi:deoxyribose-phosphate aldolase [Friedmanniella endophytica]|uniref:Deoxyribose-phosphate aldolase n=1 Tax=Microlunatus kandeliicorticis TaxID=1759536 RepID=A0A7W3P4Y3_9ACTN|nr:deoxyribose-phosphate aldolase [Microlunatus kandeliicorticis]MBA8793287.1 deoxyribose-phosphate aldolase [Microlunatus kandeliicorticis]